MFTFKRSIISNIRAQASRNLHVPSRVNVPHVRIPPQFLYRSYKNVALSSSNLLYCKISSDVVLNSRIPQIRQFSSSQAHRATNQYIRFDYDPNEPYNPRKWDTGTQLLAVVVVGSLIFYIYNLERMEESGRYRFMTIGKERESKLSDDSYNELLQQFRGKILPPDHPLTIHVRRVASTILGASNLGHIKGVIPQSTSPPPQRQRTQLGSDSVFGDEIWDPDRNNPDMRGDFGLNASSGSAGAIGEWGAGGEGSIEDRKSKEWNLIVVDDPKMVNALATFRNIVVFTGLLPVCKDEEGLAAVLGHEIGHVVARHAPERLSSSIVLLSLSYLLQFAFNIDMNISRLITTFVLELPNSRTMEYEADKIGLRLSAKACYDPGAAPAMFQRLGDMEKKQGRLDVNFLYTHPTSASRIKRLNTALPDAYSIQASSSCGTTADEFTAFQQVTDKGSRKVVFT